MDPQDKAQEVLAAYGSQVGLPNLKFEPHGCARLMFQDALAIDLEIDRAANCVQIYSVLGPLPPGDREPLFRRLLEGNLFGTQTRGATLSIDPVRDEVLISQRFDLPSGTAQGMADFLDSFTAASRQWRSKLQSGELVAGSYARDSAQTDSGMAFYMRA
jgi:hypothetical protein